MMADAVNDLDPTRVAYELRTWMKVAKRNFPMPGDLRDLICPVVDPEAQGREIAGRCVEAIKKFGWAQPGPARAFIGEIGWSVISSVGGWNYFCEQHGLEIQPGQFYAQARDRIKDQVQYGGRDVILRAIENSPKNTQSSLEKGNATQLLERLKK